jgi:hypothetical protein
MSHENSVVGIIPTPSGANSKADTTNPKDLLGVKKVSLTSVPPIAIAWEGIAMMDGARKYGPYNWRDKKVQARIYIDAALRHITSWFEGEEYAMDSGVHHLGHARACLGILIDAITTGNLIDDRPVKDGSTESYLRVIEQINTKIKERGNG